jgi:hypothetical protein
VLEPYILILLSVAMSVSHALIFRLSFDDSFEARFEAYKEAQRASMVKENQDFVRSMKGIIDLDPEAVEVMGFGEKWKQRLLSMDDVKVLRSKLERKIHIVYYFTIASVVFAGIGLVLGGVQLPFGYTFYVTSLSWWLLLGGLMSMLYLLVEYQLVERQLNKIKKGEDGKGVRIPSGDGLGASILGRLGSLRKRS